MKLAKQMYINAKGEKKVNCYKVHISKEILKKSDIEEDDEINVRNYNGGILVERNDKNDNRKSR